MKTAKACSLMLTWSFITIVRPHPLGQISGSYQTANESVGKCYRVWFYICTYNITTRLNDVFDQTLSQELHGYLSFSTYTTIYQSKAGASFINKVLGTNLLSVV